MENFFYFSIVFIVVLAICKTFSPSKEKEKPTIDDGVALNQFMQQQNQVDQQGMLNQSMIDQQNMQTQIDIQTTMELQNLNQ